MITFTEDYLTTAAAAEELGLTTDTVKKYCNCTPQRIEGTKVGNNWMVPRSAIEKFKGTDRDNRGRPRNTDSD